MWYSKKIEDIFKEFNTNIDGLTTKEADKRLKENGLNELPKGKKDTLLKIFFLQFKNPIIYILLVTIVLSLIIGEIVDALFIIVVILLDAVLGTVQEWKAGKDSEALQKMIKVNVNVLRDNKEHQIDSTNLVVGDIVLLNPGDKISADMRLITASNLTIDEAILTGESVASVKDIFDLDENTPLIDRKNMAYAGTSVLTGRAVGIVIATASNTEIGKIADQVLTTKETPSPLIIRMEKFTKQIGYFVAIIAVFLCIILYFKGYVPREIFFSVVALSVSAIPEGLPVALTLALSIASSRMAKKNVIVKKLNSVESLGSCTVIASDKTGTLTLNEQTAKKILLPNDNCYDVDGIGYNKIGSIKCDNDDLKLIKNIALMGFINNEAILNDDECYGDSIDIAFLSLGYKAKIENEKHEKIKEIPYESAKKYSASFYKTDDYFVTVKGSVETVLNFCKYELKNNKKELLDINKIIKQNEDLAKKGYRVIALASSKIKKQNNYDEEDIKDLTFLGLVGFIDPIRDEAIPAIKKCHKAGIKVVMITGDHPLTAYTIAKDLGIVNSMDEVAIGTDIDVYLEKGNEFFDEYIKNKKVFARVTPMQKLEIVNSYKRQNEFVAVTGDGVNDAPAIKAANIGISMGSGTDVAKDTSTMIITDDNFKSIVSGVEEGRNAYNNVRKVIYFLLSSGIAEILFFSLSIIFNLPLPLLAVQLLWINLVTDGIQDAALAFEKGSSDVMNEPPRNSKEKVFNKLLLQETILSGFIMGLIVFAFWVYLLNIKNIDVTLARSYVLVLMVFLQNIHTFNCRSESKSIFKIPFKNNPLVIVGILFNIILQIVVAEVPFLSNVLGATSLPIKDVIILLVMSLPILLAMELFKFYKNRKIYKN